MKTKFTFIGNEKDRLTKKWGLKHGEEYAITCMDFPGNKHINTLIETPNRGTVCCPYESEESFNKNWKKLKQ